MKLIHSINSEKSRSRNGRFWSDNFLSEITVNKELIKKLYSGFNNIKVLDVFRKNNLSRNCLLRSANSEFEIVLKEMISKLIILSY